MHRDLYGVLNAQTGIDYKWRTVSQMKIAFDEESLPELQETLGIFTAADGFEAQWLGPEELRDMEPRLAPGVIRGVSTNGNASLDSYKYTLALAQGAERLGANVCSGTVRGLELSNGRATGVLLENSRITCQQVVLAMGPWSRKAESWLGLYLPVDPLKGEILRVQLPGEGLQRDLSGDGASLYVKPNGLVWCGATEEWRGFNKEPSESARHKLLKGAQRLIPDMAHARLVLHTACLRPVTPDWLPIIGQTPGWDNIYLATGSGKKGVLLSPAMGKAVADLIIQGSTELSVDSFNPQRFARPLD